jgi:hypothetical protein
LDNHSIVNSPWADAETRYCVGQEVRGIVTRVAQFGVFVQVEPGLEGIVYAFELGQGASAMAGIAVGQEMQLYVKSIDVGKKRLELGPQNEATPGLMGERSVPPVALRNSQLEERPWFPPLSLPDTPIEQGNRSCPTCLRSIQHAWKYCVYCGGSLRRHCPACATIQPDLRDARFCCECGKSLQ